MAKNYKPKTKLKSFFFFILICLLQFTFVRLERPFQQNATDQLRETTNKCEKNMRNFNWITNIVKTVEQNTLVVACPMLWTISILSETWIMHGAHGFELRIENERKQKQRVFAADVAPFLLNSIWMFSWSWVCRLFTLCHTEIYMRSISGALLTKSSRNNCHATPTNARIRDGWNWQLDLLRKTKNKYKYVSIAADSCVTAECFESFRTIFSCSKTKFTHTQQMKMVLFQFFADGMSWKTNKISKT